MNFMNIIDLQIQTTASDGKHSPRECVLMAKENGLSVIAITDHDTVDGVEEALTVGGETGVRVIPGIEISVKEKGAHILGLGIDYKNPELLRFSEEAKRWRIDSAKKMIENLRAGGFVIEWEDVEKEASGGIVARPHIARAILRRPENKEKLVDISTVHDFIERFLYNESPYYVGREAVLAKDAISLIHRTGGVAIWSHPAIHFHFPSQRATDVPPMEYSSVIPSINEKRQKTRTVMDYEALEKFLGELIAWEIDGLEVFTPSHTEDDVEFLLGLVVKYNLLKTAGSDFHERCQEKKASPTEYGVQILHSAAFVGDYETHGFSTEGIISQLDEAIKKRRQLSKKL